jgi:hypothetical protein
VCLLLLTARWWETPEWSTSIGLSAVAALIVLVRHPNGMFLAFVPVYGAMIASSALLYAVRGRGDVVAAMGRGALAGLRIATGGPAGPVVAPHVRS